MKYIEQHILPGEHIIYFTRLHWVLFMSSLLFILLGILFIIMAGGNSEVKDLSNAGNFVVLIGLILGVMRWIQIINSEFAVTDKRVLIKVGFLRRRSLELLLQKVEGIAVDQPLLGRILGYGTIIVTGIGGTKEMFKNIANPFEFRKHVQEKIAA